MYQGRNSENNKAADDKALQRVENQYRALRKPARSRNLVTRFDRALESLAEKLDRKLTAAAEQRRYRRPNKEKEIELLKLTVLVFMLIGVGLGVFAIWIDYAVEVEPLYAAFG